MTGLRGGVLALLCAVVTAAGHQAGGGALPDLALPDLALLVVLLPLLGGVVVALAGRTTSPVGVLGTLAAGQFALHHLLELLHPAHPAGPAAVAGPGMLALHAAATAVTALAVIHADAAMAAVGAAVARVLPRRPLPVPARRPLPAVVPAAPAAGRALAGALAAVDVRRGPPVRC